MIFIVTEIFVFGKSAKRSRGKCLDGSNKEEDSYDSLNHGRMIVGLWRGLMIESIVRKRTFSICVVLICL